MRVFFARHRNGATVVEYALILTLIAGALLFGAAFLGQIAQQRMLASHLTQTGDAGLADRPPPESLETPPVEVAKAASWSTWQFVGIAMSVALNVLLWWLLCRRRKAIEDEAEPPHLVNENAVFQKRQVILQVLGKNFHRMLTNQLEVRHLMSRELTTVTPKCSIAEAKAVMQDNRIRHLLVCTESNKLVGVLSIRDLGKRGQIVEDVMSREIICTTPNASLSQTITTFLRRRISCIPVVENERCCGMLTSTDLMMALQCGMFLMQRECDSERSSGTAAPASLDTSLGSTAPSAEGECYV